MPYPHNQKHVGELLLKRTLKRLNKAMHEPIGPLEVTAWKTQEPLPFASRTEGEQVTLKPGDSWGELFDCAWMRFTGTVPEAAKDQPLVALLDVNGEMLVVDEAGEPKRGLTCVVSGFDFDLGMPGKRVLDLGTGRPGEAVEIWADCGNNDLFGNYKGNGALRQAEFAITRPTIRALHYDFDVLHDLATHLPEDSARREQVIAGLFGAAQAIAELNEETAARAREILAPHLAKKNGDPDLTVSAIGHAHIDLAWLWPERETKRKCARSFATVLDLMERYPDYIFGQSQPQAYQWMKDEYPGLYERIKQCIADGRWEPQGGLWVECDMNLPLGESIVRQLLYGMKFFMEEFDFTPNLVWLPDTFGYCGALPQIMRRAGITRFMTQKLSWDRFNDHPHKSFWWEGIDGSKVLVHMPPEDTYNGPAMPRSVIKAEKDYKDRAVSDRMLMLFGIGDGGGGPGLEHLERLGRIRNLSGISPVEQEPAERFFDRLEQHADRFTTWQGELYLSCHQGTYTTQGRNKRFNRKLELGLRELEWLAGLAWWQLDRAVPAAEIEAIWKEVLLYQFHDILPGSSITRVYDESLVRYAILQEQVEGLIADARAALADEVNCGKQNQPVLVTNSLGWPRREWVRHDGGWLEAEAPALGHAVIEADGAGTASEGLLAEKDRIENDRLRVTLDDEGWITSIYDKVQQREALEGGATANRLTVYHDDGDAWDFRSECENNVAGEFTLDSAEAAIDGPEARIVQRRSFGKSKLSQTLVLTAGSGRLELRTEVDWHESSKMLRTSFPVDVHAREAICEIQFGEVARPTTRNTSWEQSKYEVCAHRWVDLSQPDHGVALLNDCKYGHKVLGNVLDLNLLRAPHFPDPVADVADGHVFTYAVYPHAGNHIAGGVLREAHAMNAPLVATALKTGQSGALPEQAAFIEVDDERVVIDGIKPAEAGDGLVLRIYEAHGSHAKCRLSSGLAPSAVQEVNLLEEKVADLAMTNGGLDLELAPYEIKSIKLVK